jgi:signal transduction histidine kinase
MGRGKRHPASSGSVIRRSVGRFAALSMLALLILGVGIVLVSRDIAEDEARRDAQSRASGLANGVAAPLVDQSVRAHEPGASATLTLVMSNRIAEGSVRHVILWAADGTVIWSDRASLVGTRFRQRSDVRALFGTHRSTAELSDLEEPENMGQDSEAPLLEVYVGTFDADGNPFVFESYTSPARIDRDRVEVLRRLIPLGFGILVVFEAAVLALAYFLARNMDRALRHRDEIIGRAVSSWQLERRRVAQDLHDGVIQNLAAVSYALPSVVDRLPESAAEARKTGDRLGVLLRENLVALRGMVTDLVPADLSGEGLREAITALFERVPGVEIELELDGDLELEAEVGALVYRVVREALRNVARHAVADHAWIHVQRLDDAVLVQVSDDGRGLDVGPDPLVPHSGIKLLGEFLHDLGGQLTLEERGGGGALVVGRIPVSAGGEI